MQCGHCKEWHHPPCVDYTCYRCIKQIKKVECNGTIKSIDKGKVHESRNEQTLKMAEERTENEKNKAIQEKKEKEKKIEELQDKLKEAKLSRARGTGSKTERKEQTSNRIRKGKKKWK